MAEDIKVPRSTLVLISRLKPHPRNYREHPDDQIEHLMAAIVDGSFYRNIVIAKDSTILAGHGIVLAAERLDMQKVSAVRLPIESDSPQALKILAGDNYLSHFAMDDDRMLTEILKEVAENDTLLGTGFDDLSLAALVMVTRPASEIATIDEAAEWAGMPEFDHDPGDTYKLVLRFADEDVRAWVMEQLEIPVEYVRKGTAGRVYSTDYPALPFDDNMSVIFESSDD